MAHLMGIDLGTSSIKVMICCEDGKCKAISSYAYPINMPFEGIAEQDPEAWWEACVVSVRQALQKSEIDSIDIKCIGLSGQMHGMVLLDENNYVIRPAIIHCDLRSKAQVDSIYNAFGFEGLGRMTLNPIFTGFQIASLLWVKENEPDYYAKISKVILPKDYLRFKLTGNIGTDATDASGTLAYDNANRKWSYEMIEKVGLSKDFYPQCFEPYEIAGEITGSVESETGLRRGTPVVFGGADQPMQALGNGIIHPGDATCTIGTGGQILTPIAKPVMNPNLNTHVFCNVLPGSWYAMGAILSAGASLNWLRDNVLGIKDFKTLDKKAEMLPACSDGLIFLPYLMGERTPHLNPYARGAFFGLRLNHDYADLYRAVMEGVVFALRDSLEIFKVLSIQFDRIFASGGGAGSSLWKQIQADVFDRNIYTTNNHEQACTGALIVAGVGIGLYRSIEEACRIHVKVNDLVVEPIRKNVQIYEHYYGIYKQIYRNNFTLFESMRK